jgi:hypothetical protein
MEATSTPGMSASERADAWEEEMIRALEASPRPSKSVLYELGEVNPTRPGTRMPLPERGPDANPYMLMRDDPRLPKMPEKPHLLDFFKYRFLPANHLLQSATHALKAGCDEKIILACLLHDIAVLGFIRCDHGYWGAQLVEPYVDEEVSWAIRAHQALRFFADEPAGYKYPDQYVRMFGADYKPEPYIQEAYKKAREHKWYGYARQITVNDIYSFDPNAVVNMEDFIDIVGRNFRQPEDGLGFDNSPVAHMWRTIIWPTRAL